MQKCRPIWSYLNLVISVIQTKDKLKSQLTKVFIASKHWSINTVLYHKAERHITKKVIPKWCSSKKNFTNTNKRLIKYFLSPTLKKSIG